MTRRLAFLIRARLIPRFFASPLYQPLYHVRNKSTSSGDESASWPQLRFCASMFPLASAYLPSATFGAGAADCSTGSGATGHCSSSMVARSRPFMAAPGRSTLPSRTVRLSPMPRIGTLRSADHELSEFFTNESHGRALFCACAPGAKQARDQAIATSAVAKRCHMIDLSGAYSLMARHGPTCRNEAQQP